MISLKELYLTKGIQDLILNAKNFAKEINRSLVRFINEDWGIVCDEDKKMNDLSLKNGSRIIASYLINDIKIWIIAEASYSQNFRIVTILLPEEY